MSNTLDWQSGLLSQPPKEAPTQALDWESGLLSNKPAAKVTTPSPSTPPPPAVTARNPELDKDVATALHGLNEAMGPKGDVGPWPEWFQRTLQFGYNHAVQPFQYGAKVFGYAGKDILAKTAAGLLSPPGSEDNLPAQIAAAEKEHPNIMGVAKGLGETLGSTMGDPRNWPLLGSGAARPLLQQLISGGFGVMMTHGAIEEAHELGENWDNLTPEQRAEGLTSIGVGATFAGLSGAHAMMGEHGPTILTQEEYNTALDAITHHLESGLKSNDKEAVNDSIGALHELDPNADPKKLLMSSLAKVADDLQTRGKDVTHERIEPNERPATEQAEKNPFAVQGVPATGQEPAPIAETINRLEAPESGEENIRPDIGAARGEEHADDAAIASALTQGDTRQAPQRDPVELVNQLRAVIPEYGETVARGPMTGPGMEPTDVDEPPPPVISIATDDDLLRNGIQIVRPGKDISWVSRFLGTISETARQMLNDNHPLGPLMTAISNKMSDVSKALSSQQTDIMRDYVQNVRRLVNDEEWDKVVDLLDNRNVTPYSIPPSTDPNVAKAYTNARNLLDRLRIATIQAKRQELINSGVSAEKAKEWIPDTWGIEQGYFHHAFPGNWTITRLDGVDAKGNEIWKPITTGWRTLSMSDAKVKALEYLRANPGEQLKLEQDTVTLPGKSIGEKARLMKLVKETKLASTRIVHGDIPEEVMEDLYSEAGALGYGPRRIARRGFGAALQREENLPGWVRDRNAFENFLLGSIRYINLAPARQLLMKARNSIASLAGLPETQRISDFPQSLQYWSASQYGNILARVDSAIEGLEGSPGMADAMGRYILSQHGLDPMAINRAYRPIQSMAALEKLGFDPKRVLSHGLQSIWAVYPVLGERFTLEGMAHSYDKNYDWLVRDLAIPHSANPSDIEGLNNYVGTYFGRGASAWDMTKGAAVILRDTGMLPFTTGIDFTRRTAAIGGYLRALDEGKSVMEARNYARDVMDRTTGNYAAFDQPALVRQLPGPVAQFRNFGLKTMHFITGLRGAEIPRFLAGVGAIGAVGFPMMRAASNIVKSISNEDIENDLKRTFPRLSRGIFGLLGVDVPSGVGLGDLTFTRPGVPLSGLAGPAASDIIAVTSALAKKVAEPHSKSVDKEVDDAIRNLSPEARRLYDLGRQLASGNSSLLDPRNDAIIIKNLTPFERTLMATGVTPLRVAQERDIHEQIRNEIAKYGDTRGYFVDKLAELQIELSNPKLSAEDRAQVVRDTATLAREANSYGVSTGLVKSVLERAREMQRERIERDLRAAPKSLRPEIYKEQAPVRK